MAFFGGGKKKKECTFCGGKAGLFTSRKGADGEYVCDSCRMDASAWLEIESSDRARVAANMEQMKRNDAFLFAALGNYNEVSYMEESVRELTQRGRVVFYDELGMFGIEDLHNDPSRVELFRYDQIVSYKPKFGSGLKSGDETYPIKKTVMILELKNHPFLEKVEVLCYERAIPEVILWVEGPITKTMLHFDRVLGAPKNVPLPVSSAFGNWVGNGRKIAPEQAETIAALTQAADAAEQRWGKIW